MVNVSEVRVLSVALCSIRMLVIGVCMHSHIYTHMYVHIYIHTHTEKSLSCTLLLLCVVSCKFLF